MPINMPKRLIIHFENCKDPQKGLLRIYRALPLYYEVKPKNDRRLTVRFDSQGTMMIGHDREDAVLFAEAKC